MRMHCAFLQLVHDEHAPIGRLRQTAQRRVAAAGESEAPVTTACKVRPRPAPQHHSPLHPRHGLALMRAGPGGLSATCAPLQVCGGAEFEPCGEEGALSPLVYAR
jgi:hypothetical protein